MYSAHSVPLTTSKKWIWVAIACIVIIIILTGVNRLEISDNGTSGYTIDEGDAAWMLSATALVMIMTVPGLALYYHGFARKTSQVNTLAMVFISYVLVSILWIVYGYAFAFGDDAGGFIGNGRKIFLQGLSPNSFNPLAPTVPEYIYCSFQCTFAAITTALFSGGLIERARFDSWIVLAILWTTIVYLPISHWVWGGGFLAQWGVLDFAGGTVVHINSGIAALSGTIVLGMRLNPHENPRSITFIMIGTALLWFGWFGFNAGSAVAANGSATAAFINTNSAAAVSSLIWVLVQWFHTGKPTLAGFCDGAISGLVGITPAAGYVNLMGAFIIGMACGIIPYWVIFFKTWLNRYDDTLNTFGIHWTGGMVGAILTGVYADPMVGPGTGLLFGNPRQLGLQISGVLITTIYGGVMTFILSYFLKETMGIRVEDNDEQQGVDKSQHGEFPYVEYQPQERVIEVDDNKNSV